MNNGNLRLWIAAAWALFSALGLSSPALAGDVQIEVRPGLTLVAGDGGLSRHGQRNMILAEERGRLKQWLTERLDYVGSNPRLSYPLFDLAAQVELLAENEPAPAAEPGRDQAESIPRLRFYREPAGPLAVYVVALSGRAAPDGESGSGPAEVRLRIDGRDTESGHWGQVRTGPRLPAEVLLIPGWSLDREGREQARSDLLADLRQGRAMTVETTLTTGEILAADFDLSGLAEALDLMEVEMAKSLRVTEREIAELKKRLAGLD